MKPTKEQIELARKFAGRFETAAGQLQMRSFVNALAYTNSSVGNTGNIGHYLAILARAETLLAEADAKPAERVCEWSDPYHREGMTTFYKPGCKDGGLYELTTSHDASHEALERMNDDQLDDYSYELYKLVDQDGSALNVSALMVKASARQKALAIYRTITTKP